MTSQLKREKIINNFTLLLLIMWEKSCKIFLYLYGEKKFKKCPQQFTLFDKKALLLLTNYYYYHK